MVCCSGSARFVQAEQQFGTVIASRDLKRYRRKGPDANSREFLKAVVSQLTIGDSLLDVGAGVGVLDFELLAAGVVTATLVDASPAYLEAAAHEAEDRRLSDRIDRVAGDFTRLADRVPPADVVTMHRVVCCYPDFATLLTTAAEHSRRILAFSYPRDRWYVRTWMAIENLRRRLSGKEFRTFVHSPAAMDAVAARQGFRRVQHTDTFVWSIDVYLRT
jgi:2-polyprenyl-3-methyl-5-hydroxy-6-metoxy-1,4-benzoquinol methylase